MLNRLTPFLCSTFLADVIILTLEFYSYDGVFFSQIIISPLIYINLLLKDAYRMTVYVIFFLSDYITVLKNKRIAKEEV